MASLKVVCSFIIMALAFISSSVCLAFPGFNFGWGRRGGGRHHIGRGGGYSGLYPGHYRFTCPEANDIVMSVLEKAIAKEPRMAASLLGLHFHYCFVQGRDASILLDDSTTIVSEKKSGPNRNSIRGFEVIDEIKAKLEKACPHTVSCADNLTLAARGSIVLANELNGTERWTELGTATRQERLQNCKSRRLKQQHSCSNPTIQNLITLFRRQGLDEVDLVALSGGHTIGQARCVTFKQRLYNQNGKNQPDETLERTYYNGLKTVCPKSGGDNNISALDFASPPRFDNTYFKLILLGKGLLSSDEVLLTGNVGKATEVVKSYTRDEALFFNQFASLWLKWGTLVLSPVSTAKSERIVAG